MKEEETDRGLCGYRCNAQVGGGGGGGGAEGGRCGGTIPYLAPFNPVRAEGKWGVCELCGAKEPSSKDGEALKGTEVMAEVEKLSEVIQAACRELVDMHEEDEEDIEAEQAVCEAIMKDIAKISRRTSKCNTVRFQCLLSASAAFINTGRSVGPMSNNTLTLTHEVVSILKQAPYQASVDLAYQHTVVGKVVLAIARNAKTNNTERDVCLRQAHKMYSDAYKLLLTARGMNHPHTKVMQARMKQTKQMMAVQKKTGLIEAILNKKKAREADLPPPVAFQPLDNGGVGLAKTKQEP